MGDGSAGAAAAASRADCDSASQLCFVFGYGSIVNNDSRASTLGAAHRPAVAARLLPSYGWTRSWCFTAVTGFTALGLTPCVGESTAVNGVLFPVDGDQLALLDAREAGYTRQRVGHEHLQVLPTGAGVAPLEVVDPRAEVWVYVPRREHCSPPSVEHPIVQSYVDVCVTGCLAWGGEAFASEFIATTTGWSPYFLNDVPASRRPWLHRGPQYAVVDALLLSHDALTLVSRRCHPEEFAAQHLAAGLRGMWGVPRRNAHFMGRQSELSALRAALLDATSGGGITQVDLVGLGGVGKTQLAIEYCWRWRSQAADSASPDASLYGFVAWISAQTAESAAGDLRRLASDCGIVVDERPAAEVVDELKARLFRSAVPWLLVFDNVEGPSSVEPFLPRGCSAARGHVVVTTRRAGLTPTAKVHIHCFTPADSAAFLTKAVSLGPGDAASACALAEHLGHLPLALSVAAAYMRRADVSCSHYLARVQATAALLEAAGDGCLEPASGSEYPLSVASSLSLSLSAIAGQSTSARAVLDVLAYLAPEAISKPLLRELLRQVMLWPVDEEQGAQNGQGAAGTAYWRHVEPRTAAACIASALSAAAAFAASRRRHRRSVAFATSLLTASAVGAAVFSAFDRQWQGMPEVGAHTQQPPPSPSRTPQGGVHVALDATCDNTWALLKGYSLLVVRDSEGSMHRLLSLVIRSGHSARRAKACVRAACDALTSLWSFTPGDAASWSASGALIEHVKAVGAAATVHGVRAADVAGLMTGAGAFTAVALSRFSEARELLEAAMAMAQRASEGCVPGGSSVPPSALSDAHFELAKVLRYQGALTAAETAANEALTLRCAAAAAAGKTGRCARVAAVLHELGVIRCRLHDIPAGTALLRRALSEKRAAGVASAETANTLHHLALAAMNGRPPDLAAAEALLRDALAAGGDTASAASAAATWQQLGRLELRRGRAHDAAAALTRAGDLARHAYGGAPHVNVAAIEQALGECAQARGDDAAAEQHLRDALAMRRAIYAHCVPPLELAATLGALGRLVARRGDTPAALQFFEEQRAVLRDIHTKGPQDQRAAAVHQLGAALRWARDVAGSDGEVAAQLDAELEAWKARPSKRLSCGTSKPCGTAAADSPVQKAAAAARGAVRSLLRDAQRSGRHVTGADLRACVAPLAECLANDTSEGCSSDPVVAAARALVEAGEGAAARQAGPGAGQSAGVSQSPGLRGELFAACDGVRNALRRVGVRIEDASGAEV
jgi:tetratricopeptide (TPR) repeat protein